MSVDLRSVKGENRCTMTSHSWSLMLRMATHYGWEPTDRVENGMRFEVRREDSDIVPKVSEPRDGNNYSNDMQIVSDGDAAVLGRALEKSLDDISDVPSPKFKNGGVASEIAINMNAYEWFAGDDRKHIVRELIALCQDGAFEIW